MRNYSAMKPEKLLRVLDELENEGEAYQRARDSGSGNPEGDLRYVRELVEEKGL